jgi:LemA protein
MAMLKRAALAAAVLVLAGCGYNRIQTLDEQANAFKSQIEVQLQRRADLVPNLVATVKGYAQQEQTIFIAVANARAKLGGAVQSGSLARMAEANQGLTGALGRLLAISENYPQLKSNESFRQLQDQLEGTENRIATAREDYNGAVQAYNSYIRRFPQVLTARVIGKGPREYFELTSAAAAQVPTVNFNEPSAKGQ